MKIKIGKHYYKVVQCRCPICEFSFHESKIRKVIGGLADPKNKLIHLHPCLGPKSYKKVLMHEMTHLILYEAGLCKEARDEELVEKMSDILYPLVFKGGKRCQKSKKK